MKRIGIIVSLVGMISIAYLTTTKFANQNTVSASNTSVQTISQKTPETNNGISNLAFTDINGKHIEVDPNKKTVLYFMVASGCTSCVENEANLTKFEKKPGVDLVSIDIYPGDTKEIIQEVINTTKATWPHVMETDQTLLKQFNITSLDTVVVLYHNQVIFSEISPSTSTLEKVL